MMMRHLLLMVGGIATLGCRLAFSEPDPLPAVAELHLRVVTWPANSMLVGDSFPAIVEPLDQEGNYRLADILWLTSDPSVVALHGHQPSLQTVRWLLAAAPGSVDVRISAVRDAASAESTRVVLVRPR